MANTGQVFAPGRVAFITGAASGLGLAVAKNCAKRGMKVALTDYNAGGLPKAEEEVKALGAETMTVVMDVTKPEDWAKGKDAVMQKWGDIAFFHNNAGAGDQVFPTLWETPEADWERTLNLNLHGVLNGIRSIIPAMIETKKPGCIVSTSSLAGITNTAFAGAPYTVAKWGVRLVMETLSNDLRRRKMPISAHVLCPNGMATNFGNNMLRIDEGGRDNRPKLQKALEKTGQPPEDLAEYMIAKCISGTDNGPDGANFYILGTDATLNPESVKEGMVKWQVEDIILDRPGMSYQVAPYDKEYSAKLREVRQRSGAEQRANRKKAKL